MRLAIHKRLPQALAFGHASSKSMPSSHPAGDGQPSGQASLRGSAKQSLVWNAGFQLLRDGLQFVTMLVLVRLIGPQEYGRFNLVTSMIGLGAAIGFQPFITHTLVIRDAAEVDYDIHFSYGFLLQGSLFLLANLTAVALRSSVTYGPVAPLLHIMSVSFLLELPSELRRKQLERNLDWRRLRLMHGVGLLVGAIAAVTMGAMGLGVYALLLPGLLVTVPFIFDLFVLQRFRPTFRYSNHRFAPAAKFGLAQIGSGFASRGRQLVENGVLTRELGYAALGYFGRAVGLAQMFCGKVATQAMYALFPVLAKIQPHSRQYQQAGSLVVGMMVWIVVPVAALFSTVSEPAVKVVYGHQWLAVIPLVPWAMAAGALSALLISQTRVLLAAGYARICTFVDTSMFLGTSAAVLLVAPFGSRAYLAAQTALCALGVIGVLLVMVRLGAFGWRWLWFSCVPPSVGAAIGVMASRLVWESLERRGSELGLLVGISSVFFAADVATIRILFAREFSIVLRYLPLGEQFARLLRVKRANDVFETH